MGFMAFTTDIMATYTGESALVHKLREWAIDVLGDGDFSGPVSGAA